MKAAFLVLAIAAACSAQRVVQFQTKTADEENAALNPPAGVSLEIQAGDGSSCVVEDLNNAGNTFQRGAIDVFEGNTTLGACDGFVVTNPPGVVVITHNGLDGWLPEWYR